MEAGLHRVLEYLAILRFALRRCSASCSLQEFISRPLVIPRVPSAAAMAFPRTCFRIH